MATFRFTCTLQHQGYLFDPANPEVQIKMDLLCKMWTCLWLPSKFSGKSGCNYHLAPRFRGTVTCRYFCEVRWSGMCHTRPAREFKFIEGHLYTPRGIFLELHLYHQWLRLFFLIHFNVQFITLVTVSIANDLFQRFKHNQVAKNYCFSDDRLLF